MSRKGFDVLKAIVLIGFKNIEIEVVVGRDKNIQADYASEIISLCNDYQLVYYERSQVNLFSENKYDYSLTIGWRWMIENDRNLIVLHDSLLPKYRGFAPLVSALINGESQIGVTAIFANNIGYDKGEIIIQKKIEINYPIKIDSAITFVSNLYVQIVIELLNKIQTSSKIRSFKQDDSLATYSLWRNEDDYYINWNMPSTYIERFVNALGYPYKYAKTILGNEIIRIKDVEVVEDVIISNRDTGKIIFFDRVYPVVVCGKGLIKIKSAFYEKTGENFLPTKYFRIRFENY